MPDGLTTPPQLSTGSSDLRGRGGRRAAVLTAVGVVVAFAVAGTAGGWLWHHLWDPPAGTAYQGMWYPDDETSLGNMFDATGIYACVGFVGGLVLGVLTGLFARRHELVAVGAVVVGSVLAAWITYRLGVHLGPPDPATVAAHAPDRTPIPQQMQVSGHSPYVAWSIGALLGAGVLFLATSSTSRPKISAAGHDDEDRRRVRSDPTAVAPTPSD